MGFFTPVVRKQVLNFFVDFLNVCYAQLAKLSILETLRSKLHVHSVECGHFFARVLDLIFNPFKFTQKTGERIMFSVLPLALFY